MPIDGLHLTSWWPCWRYNTKEYVIYSIAGSTRSGWLTLSAASRIGYIFVLLNLYANLGLRFFYTSCIVLLLSKRSIVFKARRENREFIYVYIFRFNGLDSNNVTYQ